MPLRYFPKPTWRTALYGAAVAAVVIACLPLFHVANEYRLKRKYEVALTRLQVGDSEQKVVSLMGQPDERNWCYPLPTDHDTVEQKKFHEQCVLTYTYITFLENYGVSLDKDNRVSGTFHSFSP